MSQIQLFYWHGFQFPIFSFELYLGFPTCCINVRKLRSYGKDAFLIGDDEEVVGAELQRREARKAKAESAEQRKKKVKDKVEKDLQTGEHDPDDNMVEHDKSSKWKEQHMTIAETRFQAYLWVFPSLSLPCCSTSSYFYLSFFSLFSFSSLSSSSSSSFTSTTYSS